MAGYEHRVDFDSPGEVVPGLTHAGWDRVREADPPSLGPHDHGPAYELCLIVEGAVDWWVEDRVYEVRSGEAFLTRPGERHGGVDAVLGRCELYWVGFVLPGVPPLGGLAPEDAAALGRALAGTRRRHFPADRMLRHSFAQLIEGLGRPRGLGRVAARAASVQLLLDALRCHDAADREARAVSREIRAAMAWMTDHLGEPGPVDAAAAVAGLSPTRFHERFRAEVGMPPAAWWARQRVAEAKRLLRGGRLSVTEVAMRCGFATSQYFATVFRRHTGMTPRAYRDRGAELRGGRGA